MKDIYSYLFVSFLLISVLFFSCSGSVNKNYDKIQKGKYSFIFEDSLGNKLTEGIFTVESINFQKVNGVYEVKNMFVDKINGLNSKGGNFEAQMDSSMKNLSINMNPKIADANLFINAMVKKDSLIGDWYFSTMRGKQNPGLFRAWKLSN